MTTYEETLERVHTAFNHYLQSREIERAAFDALQKDRSVDNQRAYLKATEESYNAHLEYRTADYALERFYAEQDAQIVEEYEIIEIFDDEDRPFTIPAEVSDELFEHDIYSVMRSWRVETVEEQIREDKYHG